MNRLFGEPERRRLKNRLRLGEAKYRAPQVFAEGGEWPGDWQGRTLLALGCHYEMAAEAEEREDVLAQAEEILQLLPTYTNAEGYFGEPYDSECVNEQQLSGNSWFLRGLCKWYSLLHDEAIYARLERIVQSLLMKLMPAYARYPAGKREEGAVDGHLQEKPVDGWKLSSDVGCAFILLDGITDVYATTKEDRLAEVIRGMIGGFDKIDYVANRCQTHATLTAARGIFRFYRTTGETKYLAKVQEIFRLYCESGMTASYANFNWFGKVSWIEPCAVVDSLLLAVQLYRETGEYEYARTANRIYLNAFRLAQRPNGGAGCDTCLCGEESAYKTVMYEAFFCCSMRYAEGLLCLYENAMFERSGTKVLLFPVSCTDGKKTVRVKEKGQNRQIGVQGSGNLQVYVPREAQCDRETDGGFAMLADRDVIRVTMQEHTEERAGLQVRMLGDALLLREDKKYFPAAEKELYTQEEVERRIFFA